MKPSKLKKLIQRPLRFHHQDIHEEITELKNEIDLYNMQVDLYYELTPSQEKAVENLIGGSRFYCEQ